MKAIFVEYHQAFPKFNNRFFSFSSNVHQNAKNLSEGLLFLQMYIKTRKNSPPKKYFCCSRHTQQQTILHFGARRGRGGRALPRKYRGHTHTQQTFCDLKKPFKIALRTARTAFAAVVPTRWGGPRALSAHLQQRNLHAVPGGPLICNSRDFVRIEDRVVFFYEDWIHFDCYYDYLKKKKTEKKRDPNQIIISSISSEHKYRNATRWIWNILVKPDTQQGAHLEYWRYLLCRLFVIVVPLQSRRPSMAHSLPCAVRISKLLQQNPIDVMFGFQLQSNVTRLVAAARPATLRQALYWATRCRNDFPNGATVVICLLFVQFNQNRFVAWANAASPMLDNWATSSNSVEANKPRLWTRWLLYTLRVRKFVTVAKLASLIPQYSPDARSSINVLPNGATVVTQRLLLASSITSFVASASAASPTLLNVPYTLRCVVLEDYPQTAGVCRSCRCRSHRAPAVGSTAIGRHCLFRNATRRWAPRDSEQTATHSSHQCNFSRAAPPASLRSSDHRL